MLIAKNDVALRELQRQFAAREIHKTYLALVHGSVKTPQGKIDAPLARDPRDRKKIAIVNSPNARAAVTIFHVLAQTDQYTLLRVEPETGRTHQIRVHLAFLKHPVVGDALYGKKKNDLDLTRQFLHAWKITCQHPVTGAAMTFTAPLPDDLKLALQRAGIDAHQVLV
jgi:23S rRNA pseudouridine1911/1915/1917 synthase